MALWVSPRTLEQLEWPQVLERLAAHTRTPEGQRRLREAAAEGELFAADPDEARERLAETGEARLLLAADELPPLGGMVELGPALRRARRGGALTARELLDLAASLRTLEATRRFLERFGERAPLLRSRAEALGDHTALEQEIEACLDPEGRVRDSASSLLAEARAEVRRVSSELQQRLGRALHDPEIAPHLSDRFVTVRNDRYVLPVRADARGRVRGIVHDASASGTTLFVEPEAVVDLNNRLKEAELRIEHETERLLRELSERVRLEADEIGASLVGLAGIDLVFARAALSEEWLASEPTLGEDGVFVLEQLRHPLLPADQVVPNDLRLGESYHVLILSGPNAGGKTVAMKALALATLAAHAGLHVPAAPGARVSWVDTLLADIGDAQSLRESLSTFSAHMASLAEIVRRATPRSLVVLDEIGEGTDPGEGAALAQATLEALADAGARVVATTHYNLLKELAAVDERFENASVEFDPETLAPTYRLHVGVAGISSATAVAARMGMPGSVLERANQLLDREDRRLERTLSELAESRMALERERREAGRLRREAESEREDLKRRLERLQERRDDLFRSMRSELEDAFRRAHAEVAGVIRELQRGGTARDAAHARERLLALHREVERTEAQVASESPEPEPLASLDWRRVRPGERVSIRGGGSGTLLTLPDRRGRVAVRIGGARLVVPAERLGRAAERPEAGRGESKRSERVPHVRVEERGASEDAPRESETLDLRGLRVDEALARLGEALDRALLHGRRRVQVIHGLGSGALRDAVRGHLAESPYAESFAPAAPEAGGDGVTIVELRE